MLEVNREKVKQVFASYTDNYNINDPKIHLKIDHTYRVADLCNEISKTVPGVNPDLAWLSGMLHDIGRFEQIRCYNTFSDAKSVDHAQFGADLLFKDNLIESFGNYDRECNDILETAIRNHNKLVIDEDVPDSYRPYCNILRDADKIDILRVNIDTPPEEIYNVSSEELRTAGVSETVKQVFKEGRAIPRSIRMTSADVMVSHICLVHELVYPISKQIVRDQGYLNRMLDFPSDNEDTREWFEYMKKSLEEFNMDEQYKKLFDSMHPGFFDQQYIKDRGEDEIYEEMILPLDGFIEKDLDYPDGVTYGLYTGSIQALREIVREVVEGWPPFFNEGDRIYCGFCGDEIASFCIIEDMGKHELDGKQVKIGGPGCVGTVSGYRRQGIGLKMVQDVTRILKDEGYDISYIHYTGVAHWYAKLGYQSILKWNRHGILKTSD